jgi:hypothetical protein
MEINKDWIAVQKKLEKGMGLKEATKSQPNAIQIHRNAIHGKVITRRVNNAQRRAVKRSI